MTLYKFLDEKELCLRVRRSPNTLNSFSANIEGVFLMDGNSGVLFYGYGKTYEEAVRDYVNKIEGKTLRHHASEFLTREIYVPANLVF